MDRLHTLRTGTLSGKLELFEMVVRLLVVLQNISVGVGTDRDLNFRPPFDARNNIALRTTVLHFSSRFLTVRKADYHRSPAVARRTWGSICIGSSNVFAVAVTASHNVRRLMSVLCTSSSTAASLASKVAPRQTLSFLYPIEFQNRWSRPSRSHHWQVAPKMISNTAPAFEAWFINSLASAGNCHRHNPPKNLRPPYLSPQRPKFSSIRESSYNISSRRQQSTAVAVYPDEDEEDDVKFLLPRQLTKQQLVELVDDYGGHCFTDQATLTRASSRYQPSDGPHLTVSDKPEDEWPPPHFAWHADSLTRTKLRKLNRLVMSSYADPDKLYALYRELPNPRAPYLDARTRHRFLRHLSTVERKDELSMLRYLSVVDDLKYSAIPLITSEWNSAISFVARYVARSTETEVEAALHMWKEMEREAGAISNDATFNILFDVACKAGKFSLAEMIYEEMIARGHEFDRFHHVSLIHYRGLQKDGDGARAAYKALVEAGEVVDTIVLNAMISALLTSCEPSAAENIYERMKNIYIYRVRPAKPPKSFRKQRGVARSLKRMARAIKDDPSKRTQLDRKTVLAPDIHTYRILVNYFAIKTGELSKTAKLLDEMRWFGLPVHGALFLALFKGFAIHGGLRYTEWTEERLEQVWESFIEAIDSGNTGVYISKWTAIWALRAFAKCSGKARTIDIWVKIKAKWQPDDRELDFILERLHPLIVGGDMAKLRYDWVIGSL